MRRPPRVAPALVLALLLACFPACTGHGASATREPVTHAPAAPGPIVPPLKQTLAAPDFIVHTAEYVALHRRVAARLPAARSTDDAARITERRKALAAGIRAERSEARQGSVFTPQMETRLRHTVRADLQSRAPDDRAAVGREVPRVPFKVNDPYPEREPQATVPPTLLASLPRLPNELEYRFCDRHLILLDVDANLIVDYIPDVLPQAAS
ncbi:MAG TPA: hypothetical protein VGK30_03835 [Candidatus Binatia bacterium]